MYTNEKYNEADSFSCLSLRPTHIPREMRILTKLFGNATQRDLYSTPNVQNVSSHQRRKMTIQILSQFGEIGFKKIDKQTKNKLRRYRVGFTSSS